MAVYTHGGVKTGGRNSPDEGQPTPERGKVRPDVQGFNVPFDRDLFTKSIEAHGYEVTWEKSAYCPFRKGTDPTAHSINCTVCHNGFIYFDKTKTRMLVSGLGIQQHFYAYGRFDSGRSQITAMPDFKMSFWDRITLCNARVRFSEIVNRQRNTLRDRLRYNPLCVHFVAWGDADDPTQTVHVATPNVDFIIDPVTFELVWQTTNRPPADHQYPVVYDFRPQYIVTDVPHQVRDEEIPIGPNTSEDKNWVFPVQVYALLDPFIRNQGLDPLNEGKPQNPFALQNKG